MSVALHSSAPLLAWQRLRAGNERPFVPVAGPRGEIAEGRPTAAVFRCADSGVPTEAVFGQSQGSLIDVSTWGLAIDSGVMATLEYAVEVQEVPLIVVLGHHECRAVQCALHAWETAELPSGGARVMAEQVFGSIVRRGVRTDSVEEVTTAHVIETGLGLLDRSPAIARRVETGRCGIVCTAMTAGDGRIKTYATVGPVGEPVEELLECV